MSRIFLLDTSVILYDSRALYNFEEHDVVVPLTVLEELDQFKKGNTVLNLQAREFLREVDRLSEAQDIRHWLPLDGDGHGRFRVVADRPVPEVDAADLFGHQKNDHRILNAALRLSQEEAPRQVALVTKDINLRVKARSLGLEAEDYETIRVDDVQRLYTGKSLIEVEESAIDRFYETGHLDPAEIALEETRAHHYLILKNGSRSALATLNPRTHRVDRLQASSAFGVTPRNAEQTFALHALLNPEVSLVSLIGPAGTGKTLLAMAGALAQSRDFRQVLLARPIVPLSNRDIGFLPGDVDEKIGPYMEPLWDNLSFIRNRFQSGGREQKRIETMLEQGKLQVMPLAYIRGRSLSRVIFIVDEAQNLTPHEVKTIITRAGEGTKVIFTGDIFQIDTPYLDSRSNGLSYLIDRIQGNSLYAHVSLEKGERSQLANLASELL